MFGYLIVTVDCRLAPHYRFPAAFEDCVFAARSAADKAIQYGGDARRLAVGGDSPGPILAAAVLAAFRQNGRPRVAVELLLYGFHIPSVVNETVNTPTLLKPSATERILCFRAIHNSWVIMDRETPTLSWIWTVRLDR